MAEITKMWIADKMREIMKHKPIDKIRVTEICKAADIERPTFYYHFKDKYDLVAWMFCTDAYGTDITCGTIWWNTLQDAILSSQRKNWAPIFSIPSLLTASVSIVWALSA